MNVPNLLTVLRLVLTVLFILAIRAEGLAPKVFAMLCFTAAVVTDFLDGYIARKYQLITAFGKIMDPIADKFLILSAFFIFSRLHIIADWMFVVIFIRETGVTILRLGAVKRGVALAAEKAGKMKTVLQMVAVYLIMMIIILSQWGVQAPWYQTLMPVSIQGVYIFMIGVVVVTLWSGISFIANNRKEIFRRIGKGKRGCC